MPPSVPLARIQSLRRRVTAWVLTHLSGAPRPHRGKSVLILTAILLAVSWFDYATGPRMSLVLFYLVPIALAVAWLNWQVGALFAALSIILRVAGDLAWGPYQYPQTAYWNRCMDLLVYLVVIWVVDALISLQREQEQRVSERTQALQDSLAVRQKLERDLLEIGSRERNVIGHELHDDLCQQLVGTALATKVLGEQLAASDAAAARQAQTIVGYMEDSIAKTRELARGLILGSIEPEALSGELADLAAQGSASGVPCRFKQEGNPVVATAGAAAQLFRIAQEAMRNALRHGQPTQVNIILSGSPEATFLTIEDNGSGLPAPERRGGGMGLQIMAHRAAYIGGLLSVVPAPGEGTRVICHLPLPGAPA